MGKRKKKLPYIYKKKRPPNLVDLTFIYKKKSQKTSSLDLFVRKWGKRKQGSLAPEGLQKGRGKNVKWEKHGTAFKDVKRLKRTPEKTFSLSAV